MDEVATSAILPTLLVALWRLAFGGVLLGFYLYFIINGPYSMIFFSSWSHLVIAVSFLVLSLISFLYAFGALPRAPAIATTAVILHQIACGAALFLDVVYWALIWKGPQVKLHQVAQHAFNVVFIFVDFVLSLRINFKVFYIIFNIAYLASYLIFAWIRYAVADNWPYTFLDFNRNSVGTTVGYYIGLFAWCVVSSLVLIIFSRINRFACVKNNQQQRSNAEEI